MVSKIAGVKIIDRYTLLDRAKIIYTYVYREYVVWGGGVESLHPHPPGYTTQGALSISLIAVRIISLIRVPSDGVWGPRLCVHSVFMCRTGSIAAENS